MEKTISQTQRGGRPLGEVQAALLEAVQALETADRGPTLREMAGRACVGRAAAKYTAANMVRRGFLVIVRTRTVPYRGKPVAEYGTANTLQHVSHKCDDGVAVLASAMSFWADHRKKMMS